MYAFKQLLCATLLSLLIGCFPALSATPKQYSDDKHPAPSSAKSLFDKGTEFYDQKDFSKAADCFRKATLVDPSSSELHLFLGRSLFALARYKEALVEAEKAHSLSPLSAIPLYAKADSYVQLGQVQDAIRCLKDSLAISGAGTLAEHARRMVRALEHQSPAADRPGSDYLQELDKETTRWSHMPVSVYIPSTRDDRRFRPDLVTLARHSLSEWQESSNGKIVFCFVQKSSSADIVFRFTDKKMGAGETLTHAASNGTLKRAEVELNTIWPTGMRRNDEKDVHRTMLHEIGHALGLLGHSHDPSDVMFLFCTGMNSSTDVRLSERDKNTVRRLYSKDWKRRDIRHSGKELKIE